MSDSTEPRRPGSGLCERKNGFEKTLKVKVGKGRRGTVLVLSSGSGSETFVGPTTVGSGPGAESQTLSYDKMERVFRASWCFFSNTEDKCVAAATAALTFTVFPEMRMFSSLMYR